MTKSYEFVRAQRGPINPPPLAYRIEYRSESPQPFWCIWADGSVGRCCKTMAQAQQYFGSGKVNSSKEAACSR